MRKLLITFMTLLLLAFPVFAQETTCTFLIEANGTVIVEKDGVQQEIDVDGSYSYSVLINEPGDYYLKVWQVKGDDPEILYDETVYEIKIYVVEEDGILKASVVAGIEGQEDKPYKLNFENKPVDKPDEPEPECFDIKLIKLNEAKMELSKAVIEITGSNNYYHKYITGTEAETLSLPAGRYTFHEVSAPKGYLPVKDFDFEVTEEGTVMLFEVDQDLISVNGEMKEISVEDPKIITKLLISKIDEESKKELAGAKLQLIKVVDGEEVIVDTWTTTSEPHYLEDLNAPMEYILRELEAPQGYEIAEDVVFTLLLTEEVQTVHMADKKLPDEPEPETPVTKLEISKQDLTTSKELPGAVLELLDENGKIVASWTSGNKPYYIEGLKEGKYILHEKSAPEGYNLAADIEFELKADGLVKVVVMKDPKKPVTPPTPTPEPPKPEPQNPIISFINTGENAHLIEMFIALFSSLIILMFILKKSLKKD